MAFADVAGGAVVGVAVAAEVEHAQAGRGGGSIETVFGTTHLSPTFLPTVAAKGLETDLTLSIPLSSDMGECVGGWGGEDGTNESLSTSHPPLPAQTRAA